MPRPFKLRKFRRAPRRTGKSARAKAINRARTRRRTRRTTYLPLGIVAKKTVARLPYVQSGSITSTTSSISNYTFRANDLYDPDYTSTGHQPLGFDQLMLQYEHFTVIGAKIHVTFDVLPTQTVPVLLAIQKAAGVAWTPSNQAEIMETPHLRYKIAPITNGATRVTLTSSMGMKKFFGCKAIVGEDSYKGSDSASPSEQAYFRLWFQALNSGTQTIYYTARITYTAVFTEPKPIDTS